MSQQPRWNLTRDRSSHGDSGARRVRSSVPVLEDLEGRIAMSTTAISSPSATLPAEVRLVNQASTAPTVTYTPQTAAQAAASVETHVALGNGVGVKQAIVQNWKNTPYVFMINTNDELYYGRLSVVGNPSPPWNNYTAFTGWTFVTGAAKQISVGLWNNNPYIYLINSKDDLYYGNLTTVASNTPPYTGQDVFSGWTFLTGAAKSVTVGTWQNNAYLYLINTKNELYFGNLYNTTTGTIIPVTKTNFSGWTFITGAAKQVTVDFWRNAPYLYLINSKDELYYGNLYFAPKTPAPPIGKASFSGWTLITPAVKQVVVSQWNGVPYLYLINTLDNLYYGTMSAASSSSTIPPGPSKFSGWTFITGAAKQVAIGSWQNNRYIYLINTKNELYYGDWYTAYTHDDRWNYTSYTAFSGWTFVTGAAKQISVSTWQNNPYMFLTNSKDNFYYSNLYLATATTAPWNVYTAFSGWSPF
jgi:hypothetical protein